MHEDDCYNFISVRDSDFKSACEKTPEAFDECLEQYPPGDTILYLIKDQLESARICNFDKEKRSMSAKPFIRKRLSDPQAASNELVSSADRINIESSHVIIAFHIRPFPPKEAVQCPYGRDGAGDY